MAKSNNDLYISLDAPTYTLTETHRLVGLSKDRVRRWLEGYEYKYRVEKELSLREGHQDAVVHRYGTEETPYASFLDMIDLLFVKSFLNKGFSLQRIRKALDDAREFLGEQHFARNIFFSSGRDIFLRLPNSDNSIIKLMSGGQWAIVQIIEQLAEKIDFSDATGIATRWYPLGKNGLIVVDPYVSFGRPTIIGRGVATENVYDLYLGENKKIEPVSSWLRIPIIEVQAAVKFEFSLAA